MSLNCRQNLEIVYQQLCDIDRELDMRNRFTCLLDSNELTDWRADRSYRYHAQSRSTSIGPFD